MNTEEVQELRYDFEELQGIVRMLERKIKERDATITQQAARIAELEAALGRLLQIAKLAESYAPGELGEYPERVRSDIQQAEAALEGGAE